MYCLHVQMPQPRVFCRLALEEEGAPHYAHLLSKATKQKPLTFYLCFHLKTRTQTYNTQNSDLPKNTFLSSEKSLCKQMACMRLQVVRLEAGPGQRLPCHWRATARQVDSEAGLGCTAVVEMVLPAALVAGCQRSSGIIQTVLGERQLPTWVRLEESPVQT